VTAHLGTQHNIRETAAMTKAAQRLLLSFNALPKKAQQEVLMSLLRLPIEVPYAAPNDDQLRRAADAVFLQLTPTE
jgi:hypothetical protein